MGKRKVIGADPLDALLSGAKGEQREKQPQREKREQRERLSKRLRFSSGPPGRLRFTAHISPDVAARARAAVYHIPGQTLAELTERALSAELDRIEKKNGGAFPPVPGPLKGGRPVGR